VLAACGSGATTYISRGEQAQVARASADLNEKAADCGVESVFRQPRQQGATTDVDTLITVFRASPDAVDSELHASMRTVLERAVGELETCELTAEAKRLRTAIATYDR
jgi:hypothetical protein